jgi:hypothetical protein
MRACEQHGKGDSNEPAQMWLTSVPYEGAKACAMLCTVSRRCTCALLTGLVTALVAGCPPSDPIGDAGGADGPSVSSTLRLAVWVESDGEPFDGSAPVDVGDGWMLESGVLNIAEVQPRSDRGPDEQLEPVGPLRTDLFASGRDVIFDRAPPATYAQVGMTLAEDGTTPAVALRASREGVTYDISLAARLEVTPRCESALTLRPATTGRMDVLFEAGALLDPLSSEDMLPAPVDGVVRIDATTAREATTRLEDRLVETFAIRCEGDTEASAEHAEP